MSAILERWDRRLANWALWQLGGSGSRMISSYDGCWWESPPRPPLPLVGDAYDVDHLLNRLNELDAAGRLQYEAVRIRYCWTGDETLKASQAGVPARTLRDRVFIAKHRLDELDQRQKTRCISAEYGVFAGSLPMLSR